MKKVLCIVLVLWLGVLSNWAQAHATHEAAHEVTHAINDVALNSDADADHNEHCGVTHCCHSIAVPRVIPDYWDQKTGSQQPAIAIALNHRLPPSEIERPKWALATHAVASF